LKKAESKGQDALFPTQHVCTHTHTYTESQRFEGIGKAFRKERLHGNQPICAMALLEIIIITLFSLRTRLMS
jgi:hypothetical protein